MLEFFQANWTDIKEFFNSVFFITIASSVAGAFFGAWGAQVIAERAKYREELLKTIQSTNLCIHLAFGVANLLIGLKKQLVKPLKDGFDAAAIALQKFHADRDAGRIPREQVHEFKADMRTLSVNYPPIDELQHVSLERLTLLARPTSLVTTLNATVHALFESIAKRNQQIEAFKAGKPVLTPELYFGLLNKEGHVNEDYPNVVLAISKQTDDSIFFSELLIKDLVEHGERAYREFEKRFGEGAQRIARPDFGQARKDGLMPNSADFPDWEKAFIEHPEPSLLARWFPTFSRWRRSAAAVFRPNTPA